MRRAIVATTPLGIALALLGVSMAALAVAAHGRYPIGLSFPVSVVLAVTGGGLIVIALLTLVSWPRSRREGDSLRLGVAAVAVGSVSLLALGFLVIANMSISQDHTLPRTARFVPVALGFAAVFLGAAGVARSHGDTSRIRMSTAAIVMGLASAILPLWLWTSYCYLFEDCWPQRW